VNCCVQQCLREVRRSFSRKDISKGALANGTALFTTQFLVFAALALALANTSARAARARDNETVKLVDISAVRLSAPQSAIREVSNDRPRQTIKCDILIVGGGIGGTAAALKIWDLNRTLPCKHSAPLRVVLTEETDWLGGQFTSQGLPAPDDNHLVESSGACRKYQDLRTAVRDYYRNSGELTPEARQDKYLNPGSCWVSHLSFEPKAALNAISRFLEPAVASHSLQILYRYKAFKTVHSRANKGQAFPDPNQLKQVYAVQLDSGHTLSVKPKICLDATEFGDILALAGLPYSLGSDSRIETGEPHAPMRANPDNVQDFTYPFVVEFRQNENHKIEMPPHYEDFKRQDKFTLAGYKMFAADDQNPQEDAQGLLPFWQYRRIIDASKFTNTSHANDLSVINWTSNDLRGFNVIDQTPSAQAERLAFAKSLSLGFLYWLQNEAPPDQGVQGTQGGQGYPQLMLRKDVLGTDDGLSKHPYIREARRAKTRHTIVEQEIVAVANSGARAKDFPDSVGIGLYPIDIHGLQEVPGTWQATKPFQIPLGALIPQATTNVLPAAKNIGTTHLTNGAYRLHPIEWAIGEAQGALAFFALTHKIRAADVFSDIKMVRQLQQMLVTSGTPIYWYDDVPTSHPDFRAIQFLSVSGILSGAKNSLHFEPDRPISRSQCAEAIARFVFQSPLTYGENRFADQVADLAGDEATKPAIEACLTKSLMALDSDNRFRPAEPLSDVEFQQLMRNRIFAASLQQKAGRSGGAPLQNGGTGNNIDAGAGQDRVVTRARFAQWLYGIATSTQFIGRR
jgi:hypothetical protein